MYKYEDIKPEVFKEENQVTFLEIRDRVQKLKAESGVFEMQAAIKNVGGGDSWVLLACVDRLVELGEIQELNIGKVAGQNRVFK